MAERGLGPRDGDAVLGSRAPRAGLRSRAARVDHEGGAGFLNVGKGTSAKINLAGDGVNTGAEPLGYLSKVSAFELGAVSGKATLGAGVSEYARAADLQYIGAAAKGSSMYFGLSTHGNWSTPASEVGFNVQIDRDNNGTVDVTAFTTRFTFGPNADPLDVFVVGVGTAPSRSRTSSTRT